MLVFSERFQSLRKYKKMTEAQIAKALGVSSQEVSQWEEGTADPSPALLPSIATIFEMTLEELLENSAPTRKQKLIYFQFRSQESSNKINQYLDEGWQVKEIQTHACGDGQHPEGVIILEKLVCSATLE